MAPHEISSDTAPISYAVKIPAFDITKPSQELAEAIVTAAHEYGFLFIRAPAVAFSAASIADMFSLSASFFNAPLALKEQYPRQANNRGWTGEEALDPKQQSGDPKEAFNLGELCMDGQGEQPLPPMFQAAESQLAAFQRSCRQLCQAVLALLAQGLQIDNAEGGRDWFSARHDPARGQSGSILRLLHYPPSQASDRVSVRAGAHSDYGSVTLLFRQPGDAGLEILSDGTWSPVPVQPSGTEDDAFQPVLVNIGDLLSYWTGGWLRSTVHRVAFPRHAEARERFSIAFFCHPEDETPLEPVPSAIIKAHVRQQGSTPGQVLTADEHLQSRLKETYGQA